MIARYSRPAMANVWSDETKLATWLEVELAALDAWAELGVVPAEAASAVRAAARSPAPERVAELEQRTGHDLAAFVDAVQADLGDEGRWLHYGLTSSDVIDTALALQVREGGALSRPGSTERSPQSSNAQTSTARRSASAERTAFTRSRSPSA